VKTIANVLEDSFYVCRVTVNRGSIEYVFGKSVEVDRRVYEILVDKFCAQRTLLLSTFSFAQTFSRQNENFYKNYFLELLFRMHKVSLFIK